MSRSRRIQLPPPPPPPSAGGGGASSQDDNEAPDDEGVGDWEYYDANSALSTFWQAMVDAAAGSGDNGSLPFSEAAEQRDDTLLNLLLKDFETQRLDNLQELPAIIDYWRVVVPKLLAPTAGRNSINQRWKELDIATQLIWPLEAFIAGNLKPDDVFKELSESDVQPIVCGHVFQPFETCYLCKDCGLDETCVMCSLCFQNSEHVKHRYRMYTGQGGGLCDCGDPEAFKQFHTCSVHKSDSSSDQTTSMEDILKSYPQDLQKRAKFLLTKICQYALEMTAKKQKHSNIYLLEVDKETWPELKHPTEYANFCLVLNNDNYHSYDLVTRVLNADLKDCDLAMSEALTKHVDVAGRAVIFVGDFQECATLKHKVEHDSRSDGKALKCEIVSTVTVAHQNFAIRLLSWLGDLFNKCSGFRALFIQVAQTEAEMMEKTMKDAIMGPVDFADLVMLYDTKFWKEARRAWSHVLIEAIMKDYDAKKKLATSFIRHYEYLMDHFVDDDQETDTSITTLSLQFLTVPTIAKELIVNMDAFRVISSFFLKHLNEHYEPGDAYPGGEGWEEGDGLQLESWMEGQQNEFMRVKHAIDDMGYLLSRTPASQQEWSEQLRNNFVAGCANVLSMLSIVQNLTAFLPKRF